MLNLFLDLTIFFFGPRVTKKVGDLLVCFLDPVGIFFLDLHVFVLDPGKFVSTAKLIVSELGFLFFGPVHLLPGPCLHRVGGNSIVIDPVHVFLTWHRVGGI